VAEVPQIYGAVRPDEQWLTAGLARTWNTDSGQRLNAETCLTYSSVFQATSLISQTVAGLPFEIYARDAQDDRERLRLHPAWSLLNMSPKASADITAFSYRETMQASALLHGNGYAEIDRSGSGRPLSLTILNPQMTWADNTGDELKYWTQEGAQGEPRAIPARDLFHLKGLSSDGLMGYSVFKLARNSWGLGLAEEKHGNRHFRNGSRPNIALRTAAHLTEDQASSLRQRFEDRHRGLDSETSTAVLSGGLEIVPFSISNEDSQWLQSRSFQRVEVASWFNIPPHMLGDSGTTGYASLVEENRRFLGQTLMPWLRKWQAEADLKLLNANERGGKATYFEHNLASLIEADSAAVTDQVTKLIASEVISVNEARRKLNMNRRADGRGDEFRNPNINPADGEPGESSEGSATEDILDAVNVYATGVRSGVITPQEGDEDHFRGLAGLPRASNAVASNWQDEPTRRPVTLARPDEDSPAPISGEPMAAAARLTTPADPGPCRKLLTERLRKLQAVEAKELVERARKTGATWEPYAKRFYHRWVGKVAEAVEPLTDVWQQLGFDLNADVLASAYVAHSLGRAMDVYDVTSRKALAGALEKLFAETLTDWPAQLAADAIGGKTDVQNQQL